ncbi:Alkanesulfonate monooxygenase [Pleurostoma richardsiae]|uniref:Alkanesulfonate monooxygenase n=1 Tax=Pleurostoma richardsiae TaxID=41990 RepID=A0AA38RG75_9PEZI|nr:Alkanesulfonate monooxygenase [Pleurostoma richardsiae]
MAESEIIINNQGLAPKKQLILNAFVQACSGHQSPGLWQHPDDQSADFNDIKHWPDHDERYARAEEYVEVMYKLWQSSWRDDAVKLDTSTGVFADPDLVRTIDHVGRYYQVPGPHICQPSPQRTPVIFQAGLAPAVIAKNIADIRAQARDKFDRDPKSIKFLAMVCPIIGKTQEEAQAKYEEYLSYGSEEGALALFGGWSGIDLAQYEDDEELRYVESNAIRASIEAWSKFAAAAPKWTKSAVADQIKVGGLGGTIIGTPEHVADELERWVEEADVDGFNFSYALMPGTFEDVIQHLIPVLRKRGTFWDGYAVPGGTYRENLRGEKGAARPPADHPAARYHWKA